MRAMAERDGSACAGVRASAVRPGWTRQRPSLRTTCTQRAVLIERVEALIEDHYLTVQRSAELLAHIRTTLLADIASNRQQAGSELVPDPGFHLRGGLWPPWPVLRPYSGCGCERDYSRYVSLIDVQGIPTYYEKQWFREALAAAARRPVLGRNIRAV